MNKNLSIKCSIYIFFMYTVTCYTIDLVKLWFLWPCQQHRKVARNEGHFIKIFYVARVFFCQYYSLFTNYFFQKYKYNS